MRPNMVNRAVHRISNQMDRFSTLLAYRSSDWRDLPVKECGEPLVEVPSEHCFPYYYHILGASNDKRVFLRKSVFEAFLDAVAFLSGYGFSLRVYDGWRSTEVQWGLYWYYMKSFTAPKLGLSSAFADSEKASEVEAAFSALTPDRQAVLDGLNRRFVSSPSNDPDMPSPHSTGGAVDVWLYQNGYPVNMGVQFDWMHEESGAFYHLKRKSQRKVFSGNDKKVSEHRDLLLFAMLRSGFSSYPPEFWHFNMGNQMDSLVSKKLARYSYIEP